MRLLTFSLAGALMLGALPACTEPAETVAVARKPVPAALTTIQAEMRDLPRSSRFDGTVEAISQSTVSAQTSGRIIALPFDVGDRVEAGDEIVRITSSEQGARVDAAQSALAEATARLKEAEQAFTRAEDVYRRKLISQSEYDRVVANRAAARAQVQTARANLNGAREALKYTVVRAPYAGTVLERHVRLGESVGPGTPLMTGVSLDNLRVVVQVPQSHMEALRREQAAQVILDDGSTIIPQALRIPMAADAGTHSFRVRLELPKDSPTVLPGALVKVVFVEGHIEAVVVPEAAVVRRGELTALYVLGNDGSLRLRYVRLGPNVAGGSVMVAAGLDAGETVVLDPVAAAAAYKAQTFIAGTGASDE